MVMLFGIYLDPYYQMLHEKTATGRWNPLVREVVFGVNPFDWENLRVAFAWPDRLPYIDQIFFAISISMACLDFVVQNLLNLLPRKEDSNEVVRRTQTT